MEGMRSCYHEEKTILCCQTAIVCLWTGCVGYSIAFISNLLLYNNMIMLFKSNKQSNDPTSRRSGTYTIRKCTLITASYHYKTGQRKLLNYGGSMMLQQKVKVHPSLTTVCSVSLTLSNVFWTFYKEWVESVVAL